MKAYSREIVIKPDGRILVVNYFRDRGVFIKSYFATESTKKRIEEISWRSDVEGETFYENDEWTFQLSVSGKLP